VPATIPRYQRRLVLATAGPTPLTELDFSRPMTASQYLHLMNVHALMRLRADASKYSLGFLWWLLEPLLWVAVFYVVFNLILESGRKSGDFIVFLACGKFAFLWFSKAVIQASNSIVTSQGLVGKINVPKTLFPMAAIHESVYRQSTVYLLLVAILLASGYMPGLVWLWLAPVILVTWLMIVGCGLVGAYLVCVWRDFQKIIPLAMTFLLFTSGIFWDVRALGSEEKTQLLLTVNPLAFILDAHRQVLMVGAAPDPGHLLAVGVGFGAVALLTAMAMKRHTRYLALKVLT
jgi:lipopolysaccharide transport system permease protein